MPIYHKLNCSYSLLLTCMHCYLPQSENAASADFQTRIYK